MPCDSCEYSLTNVHTKLIYMHRRHSPFVHILFPFLFNSSVVLLVLSYLQMYRSSFSIKLGKLSLRNLRNHELTSIWFNGNLLKKTLKKILSDWCLKDYKGVGDFTIIVFTFRVFLYSVVNTFLRTMYHDTTTTSNKTRTMLGYMKPTEEIMTNTIIRYI